MKHLTASFLLASFLTGCDATNDDGPRTDHLETVSQSIIRGTDVANPETTGVVRLGMGCTGTILNEFWVLSAAHCFDAADDPDGNGIIDTPTGSDYDVFQSNSGVASTRRVATKVYLHPNGVWDEVDGTDVVLLKVDRAFDLRGLPLTAIYNGANSDLQGKQVIVMGYGANAGKNPSNIGWGTLRSSTMTVTSTSSAGLSFSNSEGTGLTCNGDSGGPDFITTTIFGTTLRSIVGVHSTSTCDLPAATDDRSFSEGAAAFRDWVRQVLAGSGDTGLPLAQSTSGLCIHPNGGSAHPDDGTWAVLYPDCSNELRLQYRIRPNGAIQHVSSGKCLHPSGGATNPSNGTELVFWEGCEESRLEFEVTAGGSLRHKASGKCVHPSGGSANPEPLTKLVLWDGCDQPQLRFDGKFTEGRIAHSGGSCIHPDGGSSNPSNFTRAVLWNDCAANDGRVFKLRADGNIEHVASGKCLHPRGGSSTPENGTDVIFHQGCGESRLAFRVTPAGSIQHIASGKCLHPSGGGVAPGNGTNLVFWDGCNEERLRFAPVK